MTKNTVALLVEAREATKTGSAKSIRLAAGLSQGELARAAGVSVAAVCRWEAGLRRPSGDAALRYARVLRLLRETREAA